MKLIERLKSPVVIAQIVVSIGGLAIIISPETEGTIKEIVGLIVAIVNFFAGVNNPTDKENF